MIRALGFLLLLLPLAAQAQYCNYACEAQKTEAHLLKTGLAERSGDRLTLIAGGQTLVFTDNAMACETADAGNCALYVLIANVPGSLAVEKFAFEGSDSYLINTRTGRKTILTGVPVFSPDGHIFVVTQFSNDSDDNLEVWRRNDDGATLEWAHPFKQSFAEDPALLNYPSNPNLAIPPEFRVTGWRGNRVTLAVSTDDRLHHWTGALIHDAGGWHLSAKSPPGLFPKRE